MIAGFGALWASIFYYSLEVWPQEEKNFIYPNVNTFMMYASGVLMTNMILFLITVIFNPLCVYPVCECAPFLWFVNLVAGGLTFLFFLVWSIMGAIWVQKDGLDLHKFYIPWWVTGKFYLGTWFKNAANTTLIFSFVISWLPMVFLFFGLMCTCCAAIAANKSEEDHPEMTDEDREKFRANKNKLNGIVKFVVDKLPSKKTDTDKKDTQKDQTKNQENVETKDKPVEDEEQKLIKN